MSGRHGPSPNRPRSVGDPCVRAYFDGRADHLDRIYDRRSGIRGSAQAWVYAPLRRRLELTLAELGDLSGKRVLDVGCGPGRYAVALAERGAEVVGVDISRAMLTLARRRARDRFVADACRFIQADFAGYEPEGRFDVGLMMGVLEYLPDPHPFLARLYELTSDRVILSVPPPFRWQTIVRRVRHRLRPAPPSFHPHSAAALAACLEEVGFLSWRVEPGWAVAHHAAVEAMPRTFTRANGDRRGPSERRDARAPEAAVGGLGWKGHPR